MKEKLDKCQTGTHEGVLGARVWKGKDFIENLVTLRLEMTMACYLVAVHNDTTKEHEERQLKIVKNKYLARAEFRGFTSFT